MSKQLTITEINKKHKVFNEQEKVALSTGDFILIQKKFKLTSIQNLILELVDILGEMHKKGARPEVFKDVTFVIYMLIIRHFTNLNNIPSEIDGMLKVCEKLVDLGLLEEIMNSFYNSELVKVGNAIEKINSNSGNIGELIGDMFAKNELLNESNEVSH